MRRKLIERHLNKKGLTIAPRNGLFNLAGALHRLQARAIPIATVVDVGASNGCWSETALPFFPEARYLCVEAQRAHEPTLQSFVAKHPSVEYVISAAGAETGEIYFEASDLLGGIASYKPVAKNRIIVPVTTMDLLVEKRKLPPPYLIKLDTHGFEVPILSGAAKTLAQTEALIIEVYNFTGGPPMLLFYNMCQHLAGKGFRCIDLFDPLYRPHDNAFWQIDMVFVRSSRPEFQYLGYY
jgi:FkbM family methyltransferase